MENHVVAGIDLYIDQRNSITPITTHDAMYRASLFAGTTYGSWYLNIPILTPEHEIYILDTSRFIVSLKIDQLDGFNRPDDALAMLSFATSIGSLDLSGLPIEGHGLRNIWRLPHLHTLNLSRTQVGDDDVGSILMIESLRAISLDDSQITQQGIEEIRRRAPEINILD